MTGRARRRDRRRDRRSAVGPDLAAARQLDRGDAPPAGAAPQPRAAGVRGLQPIMFVVLFVYVFGGSITVPGYCDYKQFVIPGIFAQTVLFGSIYTGLGIAEDLSKGFIDRLRSLPMYPSAMLLGRTMSDVVRNALSFAVMLGVAFIDRVPLRGLARRAPCGATLLLFLFAYAFSWIQAYTGLVAGSAEAVNSIAFLWMFVATFVSSAFVVTREHARAGCSRSPSTTRSRSSPTPAARSTTGATRATTRGSRSAWAVGITLVFADALDPEVPLDHQPLRELRSGVVRELPDRADTRPRIPSPTTPR